MKTPRLGVSVALFACSTLGSTPLLAQPAPEVAPAPTGDAAPPAPGAEPEAPPSPTPSASTPSASTPSGATPPTGVPTPREPPAAESLETGSAADRTTGAAEVPPAELATDPATMPSAPEPINPSKLAVADDGFLKVSALLQFWGFMSMIDDDTSTTFRVRRAEVKLSGEIIPKTLAYKVMVDPAKVLESKDATVPVEYEDPDAGEPGSVTVPTPGDKLSILQDFAISYLSDYADVSLGQFKNGLSYEGFNSSSKLLFPERSPVAKTYGDKRDIGVSVDKSFERFTYFVGLFNGTGLNVRDGNNQKDLALRLEVLPLEGLLLGAVGYTSLGERDQPTTKDRIEFDARLDLANVLVQAEYIRGWDGPSDDRVQGHGWYGALGYTFFDKLQPVVRVGQLDIDVDTDDDGLMHYDLGLNYYILGPKARLSASASIFDFEDAPTQTDVILMAQASF